MEKISKIMRIGKMHHQEERRKMTIGLEKALTELHNTKSYKEGFNAHITHLISAALYHTINLYAVNY